MRILITLIFISAFNFAAFAQIKVAGKVTDVVNGKTITIETSVNNKFTVELQFIEVPRTGQPLADVVKQHLRKLTLGKTVVFQTSGFSQENQLIGQIWLDGVDLSEQMLRDGAARYANAPKDPQNSKQREAYLMMENAAKAEKRGVWEFAETSSEKKLEPEKKTEEKAKELKTSALPTNSELVQTLKQLQEPKDETGANKTSSPAEYKPKSLKSLSSVEEFMEECQKRSESFDVSVTECYANQAVITNNIIYPNGTTRTFELSGVQWKKLIAAAIPLAKKLNDVSTLSNITYTKEGKRVRIIATRYAERQKYYSPISYLAGRDSSGTWRIYEQISDSQP